MNITIMTVGTRGDVQPYVGLGRGLQAAGHTVTIVTSARFGALVTEYGLRHHGLSIDFMEMMETAAGRAALAGKNRFKLMQRVRPLLRQMLDEIWQAAQRSDAIIYHPKALAGYHIAEKLGVPGFLAHPVPAFSPTRMFPCPVLPMPNVSGAWNRMSYRLLLAGLTAPYRGLLNGWRRDVLGLPPYTNQFMRDGVPIPKLYGYSSHVLPTPADWDASTIVTGYWFLDHPATWQPPADLVQFLAAGPPPVYVGFGSMAGRDAAQTSAVVRDALRRAGMRAVLATGAGGLATINSAANEYVLQHAPHDWLFPHMAAIVHHGGAGTTAAAARAGKPQVVCSFFGDQQFWGQRMAALGVAPPPIRQKKLTADLLATALTATTDVAMQSRAAALGGLIRAEDGIERAVGVINAQLGTATPSAYVAPAPVLL